MPATRRSSALSTTASTPTTAATATKASAASAARAPVPVPDLQTPIPIPPDTPDWAYPLFDGLNTLRQQFHSFGEDLAGLRADLRRLQQATEYERVCNLIRFHNSRTLSSRFRISLLPTLPPEALGTEPPPPAPPYLLGPPPAGFPKTLGALRNLRPGRARAILRAYGLPTDGNAGRLRARLAHYIGCIE